MKTFIVRCGETALKGQNKPYFERMLVQRIKKYISTIDGATAERLDGLIFVRTPDSADTEETLKKVGRVFGVDSISPAKEIPIDGLAPEEVMTVVGETAVKVMLDLIERKGVKTFKVEAKRADKNFPIESPQIARKIGASVLKGCKVLSVDVSE